MIVILDNIRSALNVGSIIRTSDAFGIEKIYYCGITPGPESPKVKKTSLGAEKTVAGEVRPDTLETVRMLKEQGVNIYSLEITPKSVEISGFVPKKPYALVVGNEVSGVSHEILNISDKILSIDMHGTKESLNVSVAFGIAAYQLKGK